MWRLTDRGGFNEREGTTWTDQGFKLMDLAGTDDRRIEGWVKWNANDGSNVMIPLRSKDAGREKGTDVDSDSVVNLPGLHHVRSTCSSCGTTVSVERPTFIGSSRSILQNDLCGD